MAYKQNAGRNNTPASSPIDMHGPLQQKRRIAMTGDIVEGEDGEKQFKIGRTNKWIDDDKDPGYEKKVVDNPGYDISESARSNVHKIKEKNFFRPSDKVIFKVDKKDLNDPSKKLTTEPTQYWKKSKGSVDSEGNYQPKGYSKSDSAEDSSHWTGGAPTPGDQRRSNIKEKAKMAGTLLSGAIGWHLTNKLGQ